MVVKYVKDHMKGHNTWYMYTYHVPCMYAYMYILDAGQITFVLFVCAMYYLLD